MTQETEDVVQLLQALTNIAKAMRYGPDQAWIEEAIERIQHAQSLSDRIDVLARERDHWKNECKALCDVVSEHTKARAALHQEGIEPDVGP